MTRAPLLVLLCIFLLFIYLIPLSFYSKWVKLYKCLLTLCLLVYYLSKADDQISFLRIDKALLYCIVTTDLASSRTGPDGGWARGSHRWADRWGGAADITADRAAGDGGAVAEWQGSTGGWASAAGWGPQSGGSPSLVVVVVSSHTCCEEAVSKAALGKLLTDRLECICCWCFLALRFDLEWTELYIYGESV